MAYDDDFEARRELVKQRLLSIAKRRVRRQQAYERLLKSFAGCSRWLRSL